MAKINLLPWRDELREQRQKEFGVAFVVALVLGAILVGLADMYVNSTIEAQQERNAYLNREIKKLDDRIKEISALKKKREQLLDRMKVIQELQGNRPVIVRFFDEIVQTLPKGVYFTSLNKTGDVIDIKGVSDSNNRVSNLMRRLDESDWFANPTLKAVKEAGKDKSGSAFDLTVTLVTPKADGAEGQEK